MSMEQWPSQKKIDDAQLVENPDTARKMARVEDEYHKKTLGIFPASEKKIAKGVEAAQEYAGPDLIQDREDKQRRLQQEENEAKRVEEAQKIQELEKKVKDAEIQHTLAVENYEDFKKNMGNNITEEQKNNFLKRIDETERWVRETKMELGTGIKIV